MKEILHWLETQNPDLRAGKAAVRELGFISCANTLDIKHVPFYQPCIIVVLAGRKCLFEQGQPVSAPAGTVLAVPAPASFDLRNEPDAHSKYRALIIPFTADALAHLIQAHNLPTPSGGEQGAGVLKFAGSNELTVAIKHYLGSVGDARLINHRLWEILLILSSQNNRLLTYAWQRPQWGARVRALIATDLARTWEIDDVCARLATTESTLRRQLKKEQTSFRELLHDLRLSSALMQLLQTSTPIYNVAYDCGYQSVSRFTQNFHKRFGLPPRAFRDSVNENGQTLAVSEQSPLS